MEDDRTAEERLLDALEDIDAEQEQPSEQNLWAQVARPRSRPTPSEPVNTGTVTQWAVGANKRFLPIGATVPRLDAGVYQPDSSPEAIWLERVTIHSDDIYLLPDMATEIVLKEVDTFWSNESRYRKHSLLYKRGVLLWGPAGSGKSVCIKLLMQEIIKRDGIVILVGGVAIAIAAMKLLRMIEPNRNMIVVMEDLDEIIAHQSEASVLSMLDGEHNLDNVLHLASSNYPERLGPRIVNRPSRFDRRVYVGMPSTAARQTYLEKATAGELSVGDVAKWTKDTEGFSIAHLRELVAAVYCLDQSYDDVLKRLKSMIKQPIKSKNEWTVQGSGAGFMNEQPAVYGNSVNRRE